MVFPCDFLVEFITSIMTLLPGDVILTGTPAGVGPLAAGDAVEVRSKGSARCAMRCVSGTIVPSSPLPAARRSCPKVRMSSAAAVRDLLVGKDSARRRRRLPDPRLRAAARPQDHPPRQGRISAPSASWTDRTSTTSRRSSTATSTPTWRGATSPSTPWRSISRRARCSTSTAAATCSAVWSGWSIRRTSTTIRCGC